MCVGRARRYNADSHDLTHVGELSRVGVLEDHWPLASGVVHAVAVGVRVRHTVSSLCVMAVTACCAVAGCAASLHGDVWPTGT